MNFDKYKNPVPYVSRKKNAEAHNAYYVSELSILNQFREDLFNELGIQDNPKRDALYAKAWAMGHAAGLSEVYNYALNLVDLIQD